MDLKARRRLFYQIVAIVLLVTLLVVTTFSDWIFIVNNEREIIDSEILYDNLLKEEAVLTSEVNKLLDDEYLARYAREKFFYSKDGELIIRIPEGGE